MNSRPEDRRVRKTKKALQQSLLELLKTKDLTEISVQELTERADLNRATFYLHYKDIYDLKRQIEDEAAEKIKLIMKEYMPEKKGDKPTKLFVALLSYIKSDPEMCRMMLDSKKNDNFVDHMCLIMEEYCLHNWLSQYEVRTQEEKKFVYVSAYMIRGFVAMIEKWVESGMKESPEEMAQLMEHVGTNGVSFLKE